MVLAVHTYVVSPTNNASIKLLPGTHKRFNLCEGSKGGRLDGSAPVSGVARHLFPVRNAVF